MNTKRAMGMAVILVAMLACQSTWAFYNPHTGRWLSRDPIGEKGGRNLSCHTYNNAVGLVDSDGRGIAILFAQPALANAPSITQPFQPYILPPYHPPIVFDPFPPLPFLPPQVASVPQAPTPQSTQPYAPQPQTQPFSQPDVAPTSSNQTSSEPWVIDSGYFRGMKGDFFGTGLFGPAVGETGRTLGVRKGIDIEILMVSGQEHVDVKNSKGEYQGMSVAPKSPLNLPAHRRPPVWGGTGPDPIWRIANFASEKIHYYPDTPFHGVVGPNKCMLYEDFKDALEATKGLWVVVEPIKR